MKKILNLITKFFLVYLIFATNCFANELEEVTQKNSKEEELVEVLTENKESEKVEKVKELKYENRFLISSLTDVLTTHYAISNGLGYEANPLGFVGTTVAKGAFYIYIKTQVNEEDKEGKKAIEEKLKYTSAFLSGASLNNLLVILGASTPICIVSGILFTIHLLGD